jgi:hypothetical protein
MRQHAIGFPRGPRDPKRATVRKSESMRQHAIVAATLALGNSVSRATKKDQ